MNAYTTVQITLNSPYILALPNRLHNMNLRRLFVLELQMLSADKNKGSDECSRCTERYRASCGCSKLDVVWEWGGGQNWVYSLESALEIGENTLWSMF